MKVKVHLHGGPKDHQWVEYDTPLPETLVITEVSSTGMKHHDYVKFGKRDYKFKEPK